ncbi:hypothetical protein ES703_63535 [subsurface metagenome]
MQIDALEISASLGLLLQKIFDLLEISESLLSRSSKDVFPFYLKHVELYRQLFNFSRSVISSLDLVCSLSGHVRLDVQFIIDCLNKLNRIIRRIVDDTTISKMVCELEQIFVVFQAIRKILGQTEKTGKEIKKEIAAFIISLQSTCSLMDIYKIVEKRFRMYKKELYISYDNKFVPRTNNDLEDFNNCLKRPIRKGQGRKKSWFYVEHQGESAAYYHNLLNAPHMVGGADISWSSEKTPLERIGVLDTISVSNIMNLINREYLYKSIVKNDKLYTVHRWTRKIFKHGLETCLISLDLELTILIKNIISKNKSIIGGDTSSS